MPSRATFASADADVVEARLRSTYGAVRLRDARISVRDDLVLGDRFLLGRLTCRGTCRVDSDTAAVTVVATTGTYRWSAGDERGDASDAPFLSRPGRAAAVRIADTEIDGVTFDVPALERIARASHADDRLRLWFDSGKPVSTASGRFYRASLRFAVDQRELVLESDLLAASLYRQLAVGVLECFALHGDREQRHESVRARHEGYRRARSFLDDFASLPITIEDVAEASQLSVAQLDGAFRAFSPAGTSASEQLRRVRIDAAHRELVDGDPTRGDTVREIALRWGFAPRSFAKHHRAAYGTSPKWVLDR